nr:sialidase family protein [Candidatus Sigynarchaeota archaeon]
MKNKAKSSKNSPVPPKEVATRPRWLVQNYFYPIGTLPGRSSAHASQAIAGVLQGGVQTLHVVWFGGSGEGKIDTRVMYSRITYKPAELLSCPLVKPNDDPFEPLNNDFFTYSVPRVIGSVPNRACGNAVPFIDVHGRFHLWFAAFYTEGSDVPDGEDNGRREIFYQYSDDTGKTWSKPIIWSDRPGLWVRNALVVLDDGTWLFPINDEETFLPEYDCDWSTRFAFSHDEGKTWAFSKLYSVPKLPGAQRGGIIQPTVVQLADGSLYCLNRSHTGWVVEMRSFDRGKTWTTPANTTLPHPESNICMIRRKPRGTSKGDLLLAYNPSPHHRYPISIAQSVDDGKTWNKCFDLRDEQGELSYPCLVETPDGLLHCTYSLHRMTIAHDVFMLDMP